MADVAFREDATKSYLRPRQVDEMAEEITRLERMISVPSTDLGRVVQKGVDLGAATRRLKSLKRDYDSQVALPYKQNEVDLAARRRTTLLEQITAGMPTGAEMRRNPAGAVDKHRAWERRNKRRIAEWKNIELRLHASGGDGRLRDETDVANLERFRPTGGSGEMNMHNEQIPGKSVYLPAHLAATNVMSDEDKEAERQHTMATLRRLAANGDKASKAALQILEMAAPDPRPLQTDPPEDDDEGSGGMEELPVAGDD